MKSLRMYLWHLWLRNIPIYWLRNFFFRVLLNNSIGPRSSIHRGLELYCLGNISIGSHSTVNKYVDLDARGGITIADHVSISAYCKIITGSHDPNTPNFQYVTKPVSIEEYVWIGTGAVILPGVTLKKGSVVAAGSIVTKDVGPFEIVAGNPAKKIGDRIQTLDYSPFWRPYFQ